MIEKLYTVEEVAELASVTGRTIRNYQKSGRLTGRKIGGQWRFSEDEVQRLLSGEAPLAPAAPEPVDFGDDFDTPLYTPEETDIPAENSSSSPPPVPEHSAPPTLPGIPSEEEAKTTPMQQQPASVQPAQQQPAPQPVQQTPMQQPIQQVQQQPTVVQQPVYPNIYSAPMQPQPYAPVHIAQPAIAFEQPFTQYAPGPYAPMAPLQTPVYGSTPSFVYTAQIAQPQIQQQPQQQQTQPVAPPAPEPAEKNERPKKKTAPQDDLLSQLSDVGRRVATFAAEVHDCSDGPQVCTMIDMHQSLAAAKATSERLADYARQESEDGPICRVFVEFDARYYIARYTLFGTSAFLSRCLMLIG